MKYLFVIQGEGRGHLTQAISMYEMLTRNGDEVTEVLVGKIDGATLPEFFRERVPCPVTTFGSSGFLFSPKNQKSMLLKSIAYNLGKLPEYARSIRFLKKKINESQADMVINFYEVMTGLTYALTRPNKPYICIAHQYLFFHPEFIFPKKSALQIASLLFFTRLTCLRAEKLLALSFRPMSDWGNISVVPPLVRREVTRQTPVQGDYVLGYMLNAGFAEHITAWHERNKSVPLHFFWDKKDAPEELKIDDTLTFHRLNDVKFVQMMAGCKAYATTGGFESVCEALYLQKPAMMIPVHIEQECNAFDAMHSGAGIAAEEFNLTKLLRFLPVYRPDTDFPDWVSRAEDFFLKELKSRKREWRRSA
ncbi:glycosyl transferase [Bacteroidia bacterium]|nr:glycosyl transferase [Bacteroidia bacterium]